MLYLMQFLVIYCLERLLRKNLIAFMQGFLLTMMVVTVQLNTALILNTALRKMSRLRRLIFFEGF